MMDGYNAPLLGDDTIPFGQEQQDPNKLPHPYVTMCHVGFRATALVAYMFCGLFSTSFITSFVVIVLLLCADFWTVKNITGRLMVGLRWWNYVDDEGKSHWVYETKKGDLQNMVNKTESRIFWTALFAFPVIWALLFLIAIFSFSPKWLIVVWIALTLTSANLHGYIRCRFGSNNEDIKTTLSSATSTFFRQQILQNVTSMMDASTKQQTQPATNIV
ncbi:uncharacterized Golgi apparatus membrane protein-like protein CG5021 isoform X1 [Cimex lectularius]|uniref:Golgi apparatus membrane protein TVP23 homolog n=2 Tax=Cimex lectularius TaxID=79782 RepID=A0A8I6RVL3_CIMLE|nr:uncharacterized Golgi apparatus membrane protein-like protein CG5021 isoform X1 [Cimex lectularius]